MVTSGRKTFSRSQSAGENPLMVTLISRMKVVTAVTKMTKARKLRPMLGSLVYVRVFVPSMHLHRKQPSGMATITMNAMVVLRLRVAPMSPEMVTQEYTLKKNVKITPLTKTDWTKTPNDLTCHLFTPFANFRRVNGVFRRRSL